MNKRKLLDQFASVISADLALLTQAALVAREAAIHEESKAEDQYDTRGLEASYLAGAQSKRVLELEELLDLYRHIDVGVFDKSTPVASTAVIELETEGKSQFYFLMPKGGGMSVTFESKLIQVVTPQSPMGSALLGHKVGDQIEVEIQKKARDYDIVGVW
jgi:transcription elongation GreA/GreB family factor